MFPVLKGLVFLFLSVSLCADKSNKFLLVDDDWGSFMESNWKASLDSTGRSYEIVDTSQVNVTKELMAEYKAVIWVTSGRRNDLSFTELSHIKNYMQRGGKILLSGEYTGDSLSFNFMDEWFFGFDYEDNTFHPVEVRSQSSGMPMRMSVDYGRPTYGRQFMTLKDPFDSQKYAGMSCGIRNYRFPSRAIWLGFNLHDVWSSYDARRLVEYCLYYLDWSVMEAFQAYGESSKSVKGSLLSRDSSQKRQLRMRRASRDIMLDFVDEAVKESRIEELEEFVQALASKKDDPFFASLKSQLIKRLQYRDENTPARLQELAGQLR